MSVATLSFNLFGYLPAPLVYGFVSDSFDDVVLSQRVALGTVLFMAIVSSVLLTSSFLLKYACSRRKPNVSSKDWGGLGASMMNESNIDLHIGSHNIQDAGESSDD
jgi:hypothetical protein